MAKGPSSPPAREGFAFKTHSKRYSVQDQPLPELTPGVSERTALRPGKTQLKTQLPAREGCWDSRRSLDTTAFLGNVVCSLCGSGAPPCLCGSALLIPNAFRRPLVAGRRSEGWELEGRQVSTRAPRPTCAPKHQLCCLRELSFQGWKEL